MREVAKLMIFLKIYESAFRSTAHLSDDDNFFSLSHIVSSDNDHIIEVVVAKDFKVIHAIFSFSIFFLHTHRESDII